MNPTILQVWSWLGAVLGTLVLAVGVLWAGKEFTTQARRVWRVVWPHEGQLKAAVDEPTDAVNRQLAQVSGVSAEVWTAVLCTMLEALLTGLADLGVDQAQSDGRNEEVTH